MRHRKNRHLRGSRDRARKELRVLARSMVLYERMMTTQARARIVRTEVEKMITRGKKPELAAIRALRRDLPMNAVKKIVEVLSPRYKERTGGYTRMIHAGKFKDGTKKVILEFVK